jgi:hydantoinase/carbamoylase family amidase
MMVQPDIDLERIERRLDDIWAIGSTGDGGVTRLAYSDEETAAIEYVRDELPDEFEISVDSIGNVYATREPEAEESVFVGSHLDSVFNGGRLDGALGVVVALEAIETAYATGDPPVPPTLVIFRAEESSRFGQWAIGSRGAVGNLTVEDFSATDQSDIPLWQAMQRQGFQPENLSEPTIDLDRIAGFLELHIEQGRVLEQHDTTLGIVSSIRAPVRYRVTVEGEYDHSGATPMGLRQDAIVASADMIAAIESLATERAADGDLVATVGDLTAYDGAINKVCGKVSFPIDIRSNDAAFREEFRTSVVERLRSIARDRGVSVETELLDRSEPVELDEHVTTTLEDITVDLEVSHRLMPSGGGHDAMNLQHAGVPTGMLFVPSVDGISHNPDEATPAAAIEEAAAVFSRFLLRGPPDR